MPFQRTNRAYLYEHGRGVPQDHAKAAEWLAQAAQQGYDRARASLFQLR